MDREPENYPAEKLRAWKSQHEAQVRQEGRGELLLPRISIMRLQGISVRADRTQVITSATIGAVVEHQLEFINDTDFDYLRSGFRIQWPERVEGDSLRIVSPPGCQVQISPDNMDWEIDAAGGGIVQMERITHHPDITYELGQLLPSGRVVISMRSILGNDTQADQTLGDGRILYSICGEVAVRIGGIYKHEQFITPLFYDYSTRTVVAGSTQPKERLEKICVTLERV